MNNVAAYLRVSTDEQSFENQLPPILEYCKAQNWPEPVVYAENESAWRAGHQKELARLLNDIKSGKRKYDYIVVLALDRLSREGPGKISLLMYYLKAYGCKIVSIKEQFTNLPAGLDTVVYDVIAWYANYESNRKSQNTKLGLARTIKAGVTKAGKPISKLGRPAGSKDNGKRKTTGYHLRYAKKGAEIFTPEKIDITV